MAVGESGWGQDRVARGADAASLKAHAEVQRAECELTARQVALRKALASSSLDIDALLAAMNQAEDALLAARQAWSAAAATVAPAAPRATEALARQVKRARRTGAPRPSFTYGSWL